MVIYVFQRRIIIYYFVSGTREKPSPISMAGLWMRIAGVVVEYPKAPYLC